MMEIRLSRVIQAPKDVVWQVITDTDDYPAWNKFVVACESTFQVGDPIKMKVKMFPWIISQKETITANRHGEYIAYTYKLPLGMLESLREHIIEPLDESTTKYESFLLLKGRLSPVVRLFTGRLLWRGFTVMTDGIVDRSAEVHQNRKREKITS